MMLSLAILVTLLVPGDTPVEPIDLDEWSVDQWQDICEGAFASAEAVRDIVNDDEGDPMSDAEKYSVTQTFLDGHWKDALLTVVEESFGVDARLTSDDERSVGDILRGCGDDPDYYAYLRFTDTAVLSSSAQPSIVPVALSDVFATFDVSQWASMCQTFYDQSRVYYDIVYDNAEASSGDAETYDVLEGLIGVYTLGEVTHFENQFGVDAALTPEAEDLVNRLIGNCTLSADKFLSILPASEL